MGIEITNYHGFQKAYLRITAIEINFKTKVIKCGYIIYPSFESRMDPRKRLSISGVITFNHKYFIDNSNNNAFSNIDVIGINRRIDCRKDKSRIELEKLKKLEIDKCLGIEMCELGRIKLNVFFNALQGRSIYQVLYKYLKLDKQFILAKDRK